METIKVMYHANIDRIEKITVGDWIDLRCAEQTYLTAGEYKAISLGVSMQLPKGHFAIVAPRSSTFKNRGILMANSIGIIDSSYCGSDDIWSFPAYATRDTCIPKNERICQFMIFKIQPDLEIEEVDHLDNPNRGGIGSTGKD